MRREINFFGDPSIISNTHPVGSEPHSNPPSETGMSQHRGYRNFMTGQMQNISRSHQLQEQFSSRAHEIGKTRQETQSAHDPVLGFQQPAASAFGVPAVTTEMYCGGAAAARLDNGVHLTSVWNGVRAVHSYPIPSGEERDDLGTGLITRNFIEALDRPLINADYANRLAQPESPELMTVTHPIPSGEERDDLGTGLITRNFLDAMDRPLNADYANQVAQPESPEPEDICLDLKL